MSNSGEILSTFVPGQEAVVERAASVVRGARRAGIPIIYVVVRFREGYPEVLPELLHRFSGRLLEGTPGADIHPAVAPLPGDVVVTKRRTGPFSTTDLEAVLRAKGITTLVVMGVITGGCVLSTVRWAADVDYRLIVVSDGCADPDPDVHRVLVEKVFPRQATVMTAQDFLEFIAEASGTR
ncbi:MAG: cysteine hydrolase [Betaproteobacteria bacterium]|nr:cysteine hydrolase [Betaproteobacteria bacterium]